MGERNQNKRENRQIPEEEAIWKIDSKQSSCSFCLHFRIQMQVFGCTFAQNQH